MPNHANGSSGLLRTRYIPRQTVTAADLTADQEYFRARMRRHNRLLHGCGVICGLLGELEQVDDETIRLHINPGSAIDTQGNEIELNERISLSAADFCFLAASRPGGECGLHGRRQARIPAPTRSMPRSTTWGFVIIRSSAARARAQGKLLRNRDL
ncbi:MAG: hypothetical protein HC822_21415 [Oscillochloris sp.]|nr:hypothetical protein [Oscillochloris sp.]